MSDSDGYNLFDELWLPARDLNGKVQELSLTDVLRRADSLAGLLGDVPTQVFALNRLLLAVLHRALGERLNIALWKDMWRDRAFPEDDLERYVTAHRNRFDLFHPVVPFMQVADLRTAKGDVPELSKFIADVPNGNLFFSARMDKDLTLSYAEAARWLVHCHAFDPSGIKSGAIGDPRMKNGKGYPIGTGWSGYLGGVLPHGTTLLETLLLNLIPGSNLADLPAWERDQAGPRCDDREPTGPVDLFTWQSRRIRLARSQGRVAGALICNGDRLTPQNRFGAESHTAWRRSLNQERLRKSSTPVYMPLVHDPERAVWRGLQALLPMSSSSPSADAASRLAPAVLEWISKLTNDRVIPKNFPLHVRTIGMTYGNQSSTTADIVDDAMTLQAVLLAQDADHLKQAAVACAAAAENAAAALGKLAANLAEASGLRDPKPQPGSPLDGHRSRAIESAYAALDPLFRSWLASLGPDTAAVSSQIDWHTTGHAVVGALGAKLISDSSPQAWTGRVVNKKWMTSSHADIWFRRDLNAVFPLADRDPVKDSA
ncbi:type I-E CRISPR-associated protein Cse1/CasA [Amycolatopsis sp. EV170708-02-1]|uniref:type I-E CRISPR-associated protein Cse1/CasA n=1 Tax=Amycolatopsis sp. EV170708-02-1 TaxID=2919322 RepID=UPI001F0B7353|nr:type I-E CRISPR-associated protein Cse1/CasA [Amycolatopsis sp. EV170708-02-1]UMO99988.1 type I-E CRISPR-associated protein Cse1/CasA [Amycolatopsis sp. EV170708-02-1]